ncbi:MAG: AAA family ATPase [Flavobacteriales bacterium]|nr:AAA family ATPase [Flavobacteriales bacterium]
MPSPDALLAAFGHEATNGQRRAMEAIARLLATKQERATLVLRGYAGTGKTTLVGALVRLLKTQRMPLVLLAPTGRAAKVLGGHAGSEASTIHRRIYRVGEGEDGPGVSLAAHKEQGSLFIVDEASMIGPGSEGAFGSRDLLRDLVAHVFSAPGCKLLLIGDPAQLPSVGSDHSPALNVRDLRALGLTAGGVDLTEVVRQAEASGILRNATDLRELLGGSVALGAPESRVPVPEEKVTLPRFKAYAVVQRIDGLELQEALEEAYARDGDDEVCIICRSNKRAYLYNQQVRVRIHGYEEEVSPGDRLMVVRNNYLWAGLNGKPSLIANGEQVLVKRLHRTEDRFGLRFADMTLAWWNGDEERELEAKVMLDTLAGEGPALPQARMQMLRRSVLGAHEPLTRAAQARILREDPYANALQVKYAYAVTGHKAQGGQWRTVFVDQGYITEEMIDREYVRWLYTAVTRASHRLGLLNFNQRFWGEE